MSTQEIVAPIIKKTYGTGAMPIALIEHLASKIDQWEDDGYYRNREDMIRQTCWNFFAGGDTAQHVAGQIESSLKLVDR